MSVYAAFNKNAQQINWSMPTTLNTQINGPAITFTQNTVTSNDASFTIQGASKVQQFNSKGPVYISSYVGIGTTISVAQLTVNHSNIVDFKQKTNELVYPPYGTSNFIGNYASNIRSVNNSGIVEVPSAAMTDTVTYFTTGNFTGVYYATASSTSAGESPWQVFNKNYGSTTSSRWRSAENNYNNPYGTGTYQGLTSSFTRNGNTYSGEWVQIQLPTPIILSSYTLFQSADATTSPNNPNKWHILGSRDGLTWDLVHSKQTATSWTVNVGLNFTTGSSNYYSYFRMVTTDIVSTSTSYQNVVIGEWYLYADTSSYCPEYTYTFPVSKATYGAGTYKVIANTEQPSSNAAGLFNGGGGWVSFCNIYSNVLDAPAPPALTFTMPSPFYLTRYSITPRIGFSAQAPSKVRLYADNQLIETRTIPNYLDSNFYVTQQVYSSNYRIEMLQNSSRTADYMSIGAVAFYGSNVRQVVYTSPVEGRVGINTNVPDANSLVTANGSLKINGYIDAEDGPLTEVPAILHNADENGANFLQWLQRTTNILKNSWWQRLPTPTFSTISFTGTGTFNPVLNLKDGRVLFGQSGVFNPNTNTLSPIINTITLAFEGAIGLVDGRVLFPASYGNNLGIFNPNTNSNTQISITTTPSATKFTGGVSMPDGNALIIPFGVSYIGLFNPFTNQYYEGPLISPYGYNYGTLLPNGNVLMCPQHTSSKLGIYNYKTNTFRTIDIGISSGYLGAVVVPDGRVILCPTANTPSIGIFNPTTETFTTFDLGLTTSETFNGCVLTSDGRVVFVPHMGTSVGLFDPVTNTFQWIPIPIPANSQYFKFGIQIPDGRILFGSYSGNLIGVLSGFPAPPRDFCLHPIINHA